MPITGLVTGDTWPGGQSRLYLQTLDHHDLDHLRLVADAVLPVVAALA